MAHRQIEKLFSASEATAPKAFSAIRRRPRGAKGAGVKFEREVAKAFGLRALSGQWFEFFDAHGKGMCQTDLLLKRPEAIYCVEVKLGNALSGIAQFRELYKPVLEYVYRKPVFGLVIARYANGEVPAYELSLSEALAAAAAGAVPVLLWRERFPLSWPLGWLPPSSRGSPTKARPYA